MKLTLPKIRPVALLVLGAVMGGTLAAAIPAQARPKAVAVRPRALEVWPGHRVIMVLPIQLGKNWNIDANFGRALLPDAQQVLVDTLNATGKFSVLQPYKFDPILQRALQERRITKEMLQALVDTPNLDNARTVMSKLAPSFDQAPMIGEFTLEEVSFGGTAKDTTVQALVSGVLHDFGNAGDTEPTSVRSNSVGGDDLMSVKIVSAAADAFGTLVAEFVKPIEEPVFAPPPPPPAPVPAPAPVATPAPPVVPPPAPVVVPEIPATPPTMVVLPPARPAAGGDLMKGTPPEGRDIVPKLPAASPPLGIAVPDAPAPAH